MSDLDLLVVRHGNTFEPGEPVTWVGRHEDLPLAAKGLSQAEALGERLLAEGWRPDEVRASSLRRTRGHAERALFVAGWSDLVVDVDPRLDEIDYGPWGGLTSEEIEARGDGPALAAWSAESRWPAAFAEHEDTVRARVTAVAAELAAAADGRAGRRPLRALVVSSNGVLRFLLDLAPEGRRRRKEHRFKLGTGRAGHLRWSPEGWRVLAWDAEVQGLALADYD
jgi:broad specificity phosphatase PhoE